MPVKITINDAALALVADVLTRIGDTAQSVGTAAQSIADATSNPKLRSARRSLRSAGAAAWASLLGRIFGDRDTLGK